MTAPRFVDPASEQLSRESVPGHTVHFSKPCQSTFGNEVRDSLQSNFLQYCGSGDVVRFNMPHADAKKSTAASSVKTVEHPSKVRCQGPAFAAEEKHVDDRGEVDCNTRVYVDVTITEDDLA